jgi:hypothetical protein
MIYVIQSNGKGESPADFVTFLTFPSYEVAEQYIDKNTQKYSDGHKYWTRFDIVNPDQQIELYAE